MEDIRDIKDVVTILDTRLLLEISLGALILLGLLTYVAYLWMRRRPAAPAALTPYEEAVQALRACQAFVDQGEDRLLSLEISFIVRRYLERTLDLPLVESTTQECQRLLAPLEDKDYVQKCLKHLERCDLIKFAKQQLTTPDRKSLVSEAQEILKQ